METEQKLKKRPQVLIQFTDQQLTQIHPLFQLIKNSRGEASLLAQVLADGMVVKYIESEMALAIAKITGVTIPYITSAAEQL